MVVHGLLDAGHEVLLLRDHIPIDSPDQQVISTVQKLNCILVSLNGDFTDKLNYPPEKYKGILALQVRNHPEILPELMARLKGFLLRFPDMGFYEKKLIVVEVHRIRIRG